MPLIVDPFSRDPMLRLSRNLLAAIEKRRTDLIEQLSLPSAPDNLLLFLDPTGDFRMENGLRARPVFGTRQPLLVLDLSPRVVCMLQSRSCSGLPRHYLCDELIPPLLAGLEHMVWTWLWLGNFSELYANLNLNELLDLKRAYLLAKEPEGRSPDLDQAIRQAVGRRVRRGITD